MSKKNRRRAWLWLAAVFVAALFSISESRSESRKTSQETAPKKTSPKPEPTAKSPKTKPTKQTKERKQPIAESSPFHSRQACERFLQARRQAKSSQHTKRAQAKRPSLRVGTWNLRWFPDGTPEGDDPERTTDVAWMACVIAALDVQVLAVQELMQHERGQRALAELLAQLDDKTGGRFRPSLDPCKRDGRQHVGFLYDASKVQLEDHKTLSRVNPGRSACDHRLRPGHAIAVRSGSLRARLVNVHLDSGVLARDANNRHTSLQRLIEALPELPGRARDPLIALGDWNSMGCDTCTPKSSAADELARMQAEARAAKLEHLRDEHACSHYYRGKSTWLDHAFVKKLGPLRAKLETHGVCRELSCNAISRRTKLPAHTRLSDHCPLVVELAP